MCARSFRTLCPPTRPWSLKRDGDRSDCRGVGREVAASCQDLRRGLHPAPHGRPDARPRRRGVGEPARTSSTRPSSSRRRATATSSWRSCGRKLHAIEKRYPAESWPVESLFALASIYGIELLEDNHQDAKAVMLAEFHGSTRPTAPRAARTTDLHQAASFLIDANIVCGNTLTGQTPNGKDIQFSWWHRIDGKPGEVQRDPFTLASLRDDAGFDFTVYDSYRACRIEKVHEQEKTGCLARRSAPTARSSPTSTRGAPRTYRSTTDGRRSGTPSRSPLTSASTSRRLSSTSRRSRSGHTGQRSSPRTAGHFRDSDFHAFLKPAGNPARVRPERHPSPDGVAQVRRRPKDQPAVLL